jgi:hypothetical protein
MLYSLAECRTSFSRAETGLGDGRVDDTLVTETVEQAFGDLVAVEGSPVSLCSLVLTPGADMS